MLRRRSKAAHVKPKKTNFWDRPIVITVIGTVVLGLVTLAWQHQQNRSLLDLEYERTLMAERKLLLQEFPSKYEVVGNILNSWFTRLTWIAEETNKTKTQETRKNIEVWRKAVHAIETKYQESGSLDGFLARISVSYRCSTVKEAVLNLRSEWHLFQDAFQEFNRKWNDKKKLSPEEIQKAKTDRVDIISRLEAKEKILIEKMSSELFRTRQNINDCPD